MHRLLGQLDPTLPFKHRLRFALAAYNAGLGHVLDARRLAREQGLDPNKWFGHVEKAMLLLEKPQYYRRARHGYCRGSEPVKYVSEIQTRYGQYIEALPR
jgi:membrane-bound lytic murein transglycosylase F